MVAVALVILIWKEFKLLSFDPDFAASIGLPVRQLDIALTTLIVIAIVIGLQTVGVVLMSAMIVAPAAAARQWTDNLGKMTSLSALFGGISGVAGALLSSVTAGLPTGPTVVLCASFIVVVSLLLAPNRGLVWHWVRQQRNRQRLRKIAVLEALYLLGMQHQDPHHAHPLASLRVIIAGTGVAHTLHVLQQKGLVTLVPPDRWALTPAGVEQAQAVLPQSDEAIRRTDPPPGPIGRAVTGPSPDAQTDEETRS